MKTSLERIANKAKQDKKYRFRNLYKEINRWTLWSSWKQLNKRAAVGVDGVGYEEYADNLQANLIDLENRLKEKRYRANLVKRVLIPKPNGKTRPLGIPAIEDKLVQHTVARILTAIFEQDFYPNMYGYRPNKNAHHAVYDIKSALESGQYHYVVEADIKGYFDNLNHDWIIKMLEQRINDKAFVSLIKKWLKAGVLNTQGKVEYPSSGSPQGGIISPILANIYMHYCLINWYEKTVKPLSRGKTEVFSYADDFICLIQWKDDANRLYGSLPERFGKFGLSLASEKTRIADYRRRANSYFDFLGFTFRWSRQGCYRVSIKTSKKKFSSAIQNFKSWIKSNRSTRLKIIFRLLNSKLRGYYNYYGIQGNYSSLAKFDFMIRGILFKWLNRRSQTRSYSWKSFYDVLYELKLQRPSIVHH